MKKLTLAEIQKNPVIYSILVTLLQLIDSVNGVYMKDVPHTSTKLIMIDCDKPTEYLTRQACYMCGVEKLEHTGFSIVSSKDSKIPLKESWVDLSALMYDENVYCATHEEDAYTQMVLCRDCTLKYGMVYKALLYKLPLIPMDACLSYMRDELGINTDKEFFQLLQQIAYVLEHYGKRAALPNIKLLWSEYAETFTDVIKWLQVEELFTVPV